MHEGSDVPTTDLPEDHAPLEPQAIPLDASKLHKVVGYEHIGSHGAGSYILIIDACNFRVFLVLV